MSKIAVSDVLRGLGKDLVIDLRTGFQSVDSERGMRCEDFK